MVEDIIRSNTASAAQGDRQPQLAAAVIGLHCRQVFPVAPPDGAFDDLLARLEASERHGELPAWPGAPALALAGAGVLHRP